MEDQHVHDITSNPPKLSQEEYIQDSTQLQIFPKWSELPPNALVRIYSYLDRIDRSQMSLVCRKWCQEYCAPSLWRTMKVTISEPSHSVNVCQAIRYAQKYGHAFCHVQICCMLLQCSREASLIENQLKEFLDILTCLSQLSSVSFLFMLDIHNNESFEDILSKLIPFLLSQNKVESIIFLNCGFRKLVALEILRAIFAKGSGTLKHLTLLTFSYKRSSDDFRMHAIDMPSAYDIFTNLRKIEISYPLLEILIISCYEYGNSRELPTKMGTLEEINIHCDDNEWESCQGIPPDAWKYFSKKCPSLRIKLCYFAKHEHESRFEIFISRHMCVKVMKFFGEIDHGLYNQAEHCRLFSYLLSREINIHLEEITIRAVKNTKHFHSDLINFLQLCLSLSKIKLYLVHPVEALYIMFDSLLNNRPLSLKRVHISILDNLTTDSESYYINIAEYFAPLLLAKNLMLDLCTYL